MRCSYKDEDGRQCRRKGYDDPPLCDDHIDEAEEAEEDKYAEIIDSVLEHPQSKNILSKLDAVLSKANDFVEKLKHGEIPSIKPQAPKVVTKKRNPRDVLHFGPKEVLTREKITARRKALARLAHPDLGGSNEAMAEINNAAEALLKICV